MLGFDALRASGQGSAYLSEIQLNLAGDAQEQTLRTITDHLLTQQRRLSRPVHHPQDLPFAASGGDLPACRSRPQRAGSRMNFAEAIRMPASLTEISFLALHSHPGPQFRRPCAARRCAKYLLCQTVPDAAGQREFRDRAGHQESAIQDRARPADRAPDRSRPAPAATRSWTRSGWRSRTFDGAGPVPRRARTARRSTPSGELDGRSFTDAAGLGKALHDDPATHRLPGQQHLSLCQRPRSGPGRKRLDASICRSSSPRTAIGCPT